MHLSRAAAWFAFLGGGLIDALTLNLVLGLAGGLELEIRSG